MVSGFGFLISAFGFRVSGFGFWDSGVGFKFQCFVFRVSGSGISVLISQDSGIRVQAFGFRVSEFPLRALATETKVESGTSQSKSGASVELDKSGLPRGACP